MKGGRELKQINITWCTNSSNPFKWWPVNLDLKHRMWVQFLIGHNIYLRCRSFRIKWIQKQLQVLHLAFHNYYEFKRIPLKILHGSATLSLENLKPTRTLPIPIWFPNLTQQGMLLGSQSYDWRTSFSHTHFSARSQCWYGEIQYF